MSRLTFPPLPVWSGRDDGFGAERMHQIVKAVELTRLPFAQGKQVAFVGFRCDAGVRRNQGRLGSAQGPEYLRKALANLSWSEEKKLSFVDIGDLSCLDDDLEGAQKELGSIVYSLLAKKYTPIVLGGGHETAWGHFQGFRDHYKKLLIVNFDAHYDLRPLIDARWGSSGTPFTQMAQHCQEMDIPLNYLCIGLQKNSNTSSLLERARNYRVKTVHAETIHLEGLESTNELLQKAIASHDAVYLSLCMDVFSQAYAPGVSAPQAFGLLPWQVIPLVRKIAGSGKLLAADLVELCPALDRDGQTAKLGASLLLEICKPLAH